MAKCSLAAISARVVLERLGSVKRIVEVGLQVGRAEHAKGVRDSGNRRRVLFLPRLTPTPRLVLVHSCELRLG